ncbi:unnamed protein product [Knipowitschia caucasica]
MKRRKSTAWEHFILQKDKVTAKCKYCDALLKYASSTSSLLYHINSHHPTVSCASGSASTMASTQPTINTMLAQNRCNDEKAESITQGICRMIEKEMMPISMVEGAGFRELMALTQPRYKVPSRSAVTRRIERRYEDKKKTVKDLVQTAEWIAITTDCWTALNTESYLTITSHLIDSDWELKSFVLLTESMSARHTAENLAEKIKESIEKWGLTGRVTACVHDNAKNIVAANRDAEWESVPCFAHTLQLAINDGFSLHLYRVISAAAKLVGHFNHSTVASKALERKQDQMKLPIHKLIQSCKTRWNSVAEMFERLLEQRWAITAVLSDRSVTKLQDARHLELKDEHWQLMEDTMPTLRALKCATTVMSAEREVSISNTYPITFGLINGHLQEKENDTRHVMEFKAKVRTSLATRMKIDNGETLSSPAFIASMLDPRHKHLSFLSADKKTLANQILCDLAAKIPCMEDGEGELVADGDNGEEGQESASRPRDSASSRPEDNTATAMALLLGNAYFCNAINTSEIEVKNFLTENPISLEVNPVHWWKTNATRFPRVANLAQKYLAIPGTSVPSERVFSTAGLTVNRLRTRLSPEHVDMLIFMNKN